MDPAPDSLNDRDHRVTEPAAPLVEIDLEPWRTRMEASGGSLLTFVRWIELRDELDGAVEAVHRWAPVTLRDGPGRRIFGGTWLGHSAHPMLTDLPIGAWTSASLLDLFAGRRARPFATGFVAFGLITALPTALSGLSDWLVSERESQRVGVVHASANTAAFTLYGMSLLARLRRRHLTGVVLSLAGGAAATVGGHLGGHLVLARDTGRHATDDAIGRIDHRHDASPAD